MIYNFKNESLNQENFDQDNLINPPPRIRGVCKFVIDSRGRVENIKICDRHSIEGRPTFYSPASSRVEIKNKFKVGSPVEK